MEYPVSILFVIFVLTFLLSIYPQKKIHPTRQFIKISGISPFFPFADSPCCFYEVLSTLTRKDRIIIVRLFGIKHHQGH